LASDWLIATHRVTDPCTNKDWVSLVKDHVLEEIAKARVDS
jgi:hypothetical protein